MNPSDFVLWPNTFQTPYACVLGEANGIDGKLLSSIWAGDSMLGVFPEGVEFTMDPDFPDNTMLADNLMNQHRLVIVSERLKNFLSAQKVPNLEFLKVAIRDHKGKIAGHYYIVHLLQPVDCLDRPGSKALVNPAVKTMVMAIKRLVLIKDKLPEDRPLFRIAGYAQARLVRRELASLIEKDFAGITFDEIERKV